MEKTKINVASYSLLGVIVSAVQYADVLQQIEGWIDQHSWGHTVVVANTHVVMESRNNAGLHQAVQHADMVIPDGMPLVVVGRMRGFALKSRADGPGLMTEALSQSNGWRHYFYGGTPEVLAEMRSRYPQAKIAGWDAPPFRPLTEAEDRAAVEAINQSEADVVWVGLGCPKQERWMEDHREQVHAAAMLGVGQAFDLLAGVKQRAPAWMCSAGLEWLYRLLKEPRRLWRRYLVYNPQFVLLAALEQVRWRRSQRA